MGHLGFGVAALDHRLALHRGEAHGARERVRNTGRPHFKVCLIIQLELTWNAYNFPVHFWEHCDVDRDDHDRFLRAGLRHDRPLRPRLVGDGQAPEGARQPPGQLKAYLQNIS